MSGVDVRCFGRVGVLMGGVSAEREISLQSGAAALAALRHAGVNVVGIDLRHDWPAQIRQAGISTAMILLHGTLGEDGCLQGLLETMAIPYTGSGVTASALCMDKQLCKQALSHAGLKTPAEIAINEHGPERYPVIVKPVAEGSSIGVHRLESQADWQALHLDEHSAWMAEAPAQGAEIAVSVLNGKALPPVEIVPGSGVYDYVAKYTVGATDYFCPARLPAESLHLTMRCAEIAVMATKCSGAPRVDMFVDDNGEPVILEINTLPGMTETSLLPKAAAVAGLGFESLCLHILAAAGLEHAAAPEQASGHRRAAGGVA